MIAATFYKRTGQYLRVKGVKRGDTAALLSNATVIATMRYGAATVPEVNNIMLLPIEGSDGDYEVVIPASFDPKAGLSYTLDVDITCAGLEPAHRELPVSVQLPSTP